MIELNATQFFILLIFGFVFGWVAGFFGRNLK